MALKRVEFDRGALFTQGAHVVDWTPAGHRPVLFLSGKSLFESGKPIRGGVPIIFPWFGSRPEGMHGYARTRVWDVEEQLSDRVTLRLTTDLFELKFHAVFGDSLQMSLQAANTSSEPQTVEMALHTYLSISDIHNVAVSGLDGAEYIDKTDEFRHKQQAGEIRVSEATDRVFLNTTATCTVIDPAWDRRIAIDKSGSNTTVVWNPYTELTDLEDWRGMICVETANAADNAITIQPGDRHTMTATISVSHDS